MISLYQVCDRFGDYVYNTFNVDFSTCNTISSLAMKIYITKFNTKNIPLITNHNIFYNIKEGYFGGISEVYRPYGENLYYYVINSQYPHASLKPMPGLKCKILSKIDKDLKDLKDLFGFYYCEIYAPKDLYIGLLPVRLDDGNYLPCGYWKGTYFSEQLKLAASQGYKIRVLSGFKFESSYDNFRNYVLKLFEIKSTSNEMISFIIKSLLNNLFGRLGMSLEKQVTKVVEADLLKKIVATKEITKLEQYKDLYAFLVTF